MGTEKTKEVPVVQPFFDEWIIPVGRYILNMGSVEIATRLLVAQIEGTYTSPVFNDPLDSRIGFIRNRFPRDNKTRHKWAMNVLTVAKKHIDFRNIMAHNPLVLTQNADGATQIQGIINVKSNEIILLPEIMARVEEAAKLVGLLIQMKSYFPPGSTQNNVAPAV
jgi:hypothetical protein